MAILLAALVLFYGPTLYRLVQDWVSDSEYTINFLLPALSSWLLWRERRHLAALGGRPSWLGLAGLLLAVALHLTGTLAAEFYSARVSFVLALAALILYLAGWPVLKSVVVPLILLLLTIPIPAIVYTLAALPLESWAARLAVWAMSMAGVTVLLQGNLLLFPSATLEVDQICGGMRGAVALVGFAVALGSLTRQSRWIRLSLVLACLPIAVLSSALRLCAAGFAAASFGYAWPAGHVGPGLGAAAFAIAAALIILTQNALRRFVGRRTADGVS